MYKKFTDDNEKTNYKMKKNQQLRLEGFLDAIASINGGMRINKLVRIIKPFLTADEPF